ncbi:MAG: SDR family oxidoreductase [Rhodobacteraceae bacterium]|nr:SDR family oxidoreductase [Paracoccaceae bacterium]PHR55917.1 MAG: oxidoreductase [Robiginitomaculum sp.]
MNKATETHRILVLGGYGLIGASVTRHLIMRGHDVSILGRNRATAAKVLPQTPLICKDLTDMCHAEAWHDILPGFDIVVNCAGALQDTPSDNVLAVQETSISALAQACGARGTGLIQISAAGVATDNPSKFFATKARADAAIKEHMNRFWIFRPGLVLAKTAYGGTTLLRMVAAVPLLQPIAEPAALIQTISVTDIANAVAMAVAGQIPQGTICDLVEDEAHTLAELVATYRQWLGFAPARRMFVLPRWLVTCMSFGADALGRLGWRSPLRSTATQVLRDGVLGAAQPWQQLSGQKISAMAQTFAAMTAGVEDRMFARMALLMPFVIAVLFAFWFISGLVGIISASEAADVLVASGWNKGLALASVLFWSIVDIGLAGALLWRKTAARATMAMVGVSLTYLLLATAVTPLLWLDPLGPLIKIFPALILAVVARIMLETR